MIVRNAVQEVQYRRAVLTFEGVKSDAIFNYPAPFNIIAIIVFLPLKRVLSQRMFHKVNVACVKTINLPILLVIAWYERKTLWVTEKHSRFKPRHIDWTNPFGPRATSKGWWSRAMIFWDLSRFSAHGDLQAVFDITPPDDLIDEENEDDEDQGPPDGPRKNSNIGKRIIRSFTLQFGPSADPRNDSITQEPRKLSIASKIDNHMRRRKSSTGSVLQAKLRARSRSRSKSSGANVRREFPDSSSSSDEPGKEQKRDHPRGHRKLTRHERLDSLIDFSADAPLGMTEANARLQKMEKSLSRLEELVLALVDATGGEARDSDDDEGEEAAESEMVGEREMGPS